jgi:hypothetical protein
LLCSAIEEQYPVEWQAAGAYCQLETKRVRFGAGSRLSLEGITHQPPKPLSAHAYPTKIFSIFQSLWKILKRILDYREY